jgi:hypothetical protein
VAPATTSDQPTSTSGATDTTGATPGGGGTGVVSQTERYSPKEGPFVICQDCHPYLDVPGKVPATLMSNFSHVNHLERQATCDSCHETPVHAASGTRTPTMARCFTCHGDEPQAQASGECDYCHPPDFPIMPASHTQQFFQGGHARLVEQSGSEDCLFCHEGTEETFCRACHGIDLPHPDDWVRAQSGEPGGHVAAAYEQGESCARCHDNRVEPPASCYGGECHGD